MKRKVLFIVLMLSVCAGLVSAQTIDFDYFVHLPIVLNNEDATPTPTPTYPPHPPTNTPPASMTTLYWNNKNMNGYPACYEVLGTGIGRQCRPIGDVWRLYGSFPSGWYKVVYGSARCKVKSPNKWFRAGEVRHTLFCTPP